MIGTTVTAVPDGSLAIFVKLFAPDFSSPSDILTSLPTPAKALRLAKVAEAADDVADASKAADNVGPAASVDNAADARRADGCSFTAETLVLMANGIRKPIGDVRAGERVIATDPLTRQQSRRTVTHVFVHRDVVVDLDVEGEQLTTTEDHPFWNETDGNWQRADQLDQGDALRTASGGTVRLNRAGVRSPRVASAYNLDVAGVDTFHVGRAAILVHNQERGDDACRLPGLEDVPEHIGPGPFARESIPAHRGRATPTEQRQVNGMMDRHGCHRCGTKDPGTSTGNAVADHQPPASMDEPLYFLPHCIGCARQQAGYVTAEKKRRKAAGG